jgi:(p)ppGpp synthase/HD superfamily hydrolase
MSGPDSLYTGRFMDALRVAAELHASQRRKGTGVPYVAHLLGTCTIALEFGANEDQAIAALLHDAIEDVRPTTMAREAVANFGPEVLRIVEACTDSEADDDPKPAWRERKKRYLASIPEADASVLLVSAADKLYNARAIAIDLRRVGPAVWDRFDGGRDDRIWYYRSLVDAYRGNPASEPHLIEELARTVDEVERMA